MNRRGFLTAPGTLLASVPVLGKLFKRKAKEGRALSDLDQAPMTTLIAGCGPMGGKIVFKASGLDDNVLEFCPGGEFRYRGHLIETDIELYRAFRQFLKPIIQQVGG